MILARYMKVHYVILNKRAFPNTQNTQQSISAGAISCSGHFATHSLSTHNEGQNGAAWSARGMCTNSEQKVIDNFRDITRNVEENEILYEILRVVSHFPCYISWYISEDRLPLHGTQCIHPKYPAINQCSSRHFLFRPFCPTLSLSIMRDKMAQHGQRAARVRTTWTTK